MQLLHVDLEVRFAAARRRAQLALEDGLVPCVDQLVRLQRIALSRQMDGWMD